MALTHDPLARTLPWLQQPLTQALQVQRGHALLIQGSPGIGQFDFALGLAQAWLCEAPATARAGGVLACGSCPACHLWRSRSHPDALILIPAAQAEAIGWQAAADESQAGGGDSKSRGKPSLEIKVDAVRQAVTFAQQTTSRGIAKVVVICPAEQMNNIAANTLLKTLEEPAGAARFILASGHADRLLPTIRSRCQSIEQPLPDQPTALAWLTAQGVEAPEIMLAAAGGQALSALEWVEQGIHAGLWRQIPQQVRSGVPGVMLSWSVQQVVQVLLKLSCDALRITAGRSPMFFPADTLPAEGNLTRLTAWAAELRKFARHADHPLNASLQIEALIQRARLALSV